MRFTARESRPDASLRLALSAPAAFLSVASSAARRAAMPRGRSRRIEQLQRGGSLAPGFEDRLDRCPVLLPQTKEHVAPAFDLRQPSGILLDRFGVVRRESRKLREIGVSGVQ
jgi:hypothetical protein